MKKSVKLEPKLLLHHDIFVFLVLFLSLSGIGQVYSQSTDAVGVSISNDVDTFTESEDVDNQHGTPTRTAEESREYWAARESLPWEKMAILYTSQISMPVLAYFSRYEIGNTILVSYEAINGTMFVIGGISMYSKSFAKNPALSATLKLLGGLSFLALAYYQHTEVGSSDPESRFWKAYLAYQLFAIPIEIYALTIEY